MVLINILRLIKGVVMYDERLWVEVALLDLKYGNGGLIPRKDGDGIAFQFVKDNTAEANNDKGK